MKLIALLPFKDEAWILPAYLSSVAPVVDEIVAIDDGSIDESRRLVEDAGGHVVAADVAGAWGDGTGGREHSIRDSLLRVGRERGGTHFLSLDADEALTAPAQSNLRGAVAELREGQKLAMQWVTLWKDPARYRHDDSVWTDLYKDFAFADLPGSEFPGVARTPGDNSEANWLKLPPEQGAVLHYQFVPWWRCQAKQAWYRCSELLRRPGDAYDINRTFTVSLDSPDDRTAPIPAGWLEGVQVPPGLAELPPAWHLAAILAWFDDYGVELFEPLQIWHVPELHAEFVRATGREPEALTHIGPARRVMRAVSSRVQAARASRA